VYFLDHSNPVCHIKGIVVFAQSDVALLESSRGDESVDLFALDIVKIPNSSLDLTLVGLDIDNKDQRVAVLNQLHGRLGSQGVLDDGVLVQSVLFRQSLGGIFGLTVTCKSLGLVEVHLCVDTGALLGDALLQGLGNGFCFAYGTQEYREKEIGR